MPSSFPVWWPLNQFLCYQWAPGGTCSPWFCLPAPPPAPRVPVGSGVSMPGFADSLARLDGADAHRGRVAARRADAARLCPHRGRLPSLARGQDLGHQGPRGDRLSLLSTRAGVSFERRRDHRPPQRRLDRPADRGCSPKDRVPGQPRHASCATSYPGAPAASCCAAPLRASRWWRSSWCRC